jgi:hypothetical protein
MKREPPCSEKIHLMSAYEEAAMCYSSAVTRLRRTMGTMTQSEYERAYETTEHLRLKSREVQGTLDRHVGVHGC